MYAYAMSKLLRHFRPNQSCFITAVTANRQPILERYADLLLGAVRSAKRESRFTIIAWVILSDHFHAVVHDPRGDTSKIVQRVKLSFSLQYRRLVGGSGPVWQHRFWDHIIRSEEDMRNHVDYIHLNPVKHGLTSTPGGWSLSSFQDFVETGRYDANWGEGVIIDRESEYGE